MHIFAVTLNQYQYVQLKFDKDPVNLRAALGNWHTVIYWISGAWLDIGSPSEFDIILQNMAAERYLAYMDEWITALRFMQYSDIGLSIGMPSPRIKSAKPRLTDL
jgi:hypothetical protein